MCYDFASCVDIDFARSSLSQVASSVWGASEWKYEGPGFESHLRLTLFLASSNLNTILNTIDIT